MLSCLGLSWFHAEGTFFIVGPRQKSVLDLIVQKLNERTVTKQDVHVFIDDVTSCVSCSSGDQQLEGLLSSTCL